MLVFVLLENINFWKKYQISPTRSFIDNLMKNVKISVIFKQINVTVSRPGNTVPFLQLVCLGTRVRIKILNSKIVEWLIFRIWKLFSKLLWLTDLKNYQIFKIVQFEKLMNFQNLKLWKMKKTLNLTIRKI